MFSVESFPESSRKSKGSSVNWRQSYCGKRIPFSPEEKFINLGVMFGFLKEENGHVTVANRMFEMCLLNMFMAKEAINSEVYAQGGSDRIGFIKNFN